MLTVFAKVKSCKKNSCYNLKRKKNTMKATYDKKTKTLTIQVQIDETGKPSTSGKNQTHFTTGGNVSIGDLLGNGSDLKCGLNVYGKPA